MTGNVDRCEAPFRARKRGPFPDRPDRNSPYWLQTGNPFLLEKSEEYMDKDYFEDINASSRSDGRQV